MSSMKGCRLPNECMIDTALRSTILSPLHVVNPVHLVVLAMTLLTVRHCCFQSLHPMLKERQQHGLKATGQQR